MPLKWIAYKELGLMVVGKAVALLLTTIGLWGPGNHSTTDLQQSGIRQQVKIEN